ncbi:hypothetical protein CDAR_52651 [Caerostris darwini]|uniref:Uncharacterized protein n=1 Tax=Caerostris darwini TaxID=1538125 RepID=A0AAV4T1K5_9ARAC|nr:hypothetical protein CDAR_52651 [Caerostris darwini]
MDGAKHLYFRTSPNFHSTEIGRIPTGIPIRFQPITARSPKRKTTFFREQTATKKATHKYIPNVLLATTCHFIKIHHPQNVVLPMFAPERADGIQGYGHSVLPEWR